MSEDWINQVTLNCLMNKQQYEKYLSSNIKKKNNEENKQKYSSRILDLTKELLEEFNNNDEIPPDIYYSFENYIKTCIHYFKIHDNNLLIQEQYKELDNVSIQEINEIINEKCLSEFEKTDSDQINQKLSMKKSIKICNANLNSFINSNYAKKILEETEKETLEDNYEKTLEDNYEENLEDN